MSALVTDDRADSGENGREDGDYLRKTGAPFGVIAVAFGLMLDCVIMRAVYVKFLL